jgi:hypothetical protein
MRIKLFEEWCVDVYESKKDFLPFEEAREFVQSLGLNTQIEWIAWAKSKERPENIPAAPHITYGDKGWISYGDWLGTGRVRYINFLPFEEAREFARSLGLNTQKEWHAWVASKERPENIPSAPHVTYGDKGWISWGDWLGTDNKEKIDYVSYDLAKEMIQPFEIKSPVEWTQYYRMDLIPKTVPKNPSVFYADKGWMGWEDFLGSRKKFG